MAGRPPSDVWALYTKDNNDAATKEQKPYVDIFQGKLHAANATKFKLWLAFDCPEFMKSRPLEWQRLVAGLTAANVKPRKTGDHRTWQQCVAAVQTRKSGGSGGGSGGAKGASNHLSTRLVRAGAYGGSIAASGLSAAKLQVKQNGSRFREALPSSHVQLSLRHANRRVCERVLRSRRNFLIYFFPGI